MKHFGGEAAAGLLFGLLYLGIFIFLTYLYATKQIKFRSRYSFIYLHVFIRIGSQATAIAFALVGWEDPGPELLTAYLILGAEGYFSLILCAYRFLIVWDQLRHGVSTLEPRVPKGTPFWKGLRMAYSGKMAYIDWALIVANALIISGGSMIGAQLSKPVDERKDGNISSGRIIRAVGGAIFLCLVQIYVLLCVRRYKRGPRDGTLLLMMATWPWLTVRGAFGIAQTLGGQFNYYSPENYNSDGFKPSFIAGEYVLATLMEFVSCMLLVSTWFAPGEKQFRAREAGDVELEHTDGEGLHKSGKEMGAGTP